VAQQRRRRFLGGPGFLGWWLFWAFVLFWPLLLPEPAGGVVLAAWLALAGGLTVLARKGGRGTRAT